MKTSNFKFPGKRMVAVFFLFFLLFLPQTATTAETETTDKKKGEKIHITADKLISSTNDNNSEFIGNVRVWQGKNQIDADHLQIFFTGGSGAEDSSPEQSLEKLVASGNVKIKFDNRLAVANKAVYITKKRLLTLTGPGAKITSGENTISGETITFYRDDGRFTVDGGTNSRVEAVIRPNDSGLK